MPIDKNPPRLKIAVFNDTRPAKHFGCELVMRELIANLTRHGMDPVWFHPVRVDWRENISSIPRRPQIDAVIVNGEGSIHHSSIRPRAVFLSEIASFARQHLDVPAFLINASISDIDNVTAVNLKSFHRIYVRETESKTVLEQYDIPSVVVPDLTMQAQFDVPTARSGVCGTDSVLVDVSRTIRALCNRNGWQFRSMTMGGKKSDATTDNNELFRDFVRWLGSHQLVVTGRFHTVTFCIATGTPFVAVESNTPKISSFVRDTFGETKRVVLQEEIERLEVERFQHWTRDEAVAIAESVQRARSQTDNMFRKIGDITKSCTRRCGHVKL